jgi:unspecific peroxygenase
MDLRYQRYKDSMATNPTFDYSAIRYFGAISEAIFPYIFFVDGRVSDQRLDMNTARSFFEFGRMPRDFYRANHSLSGPEHAQQCVEFIDDLPEVKVGKNNGTAVDSFIVDPTFEPVLEMCKGYKDFANLIGLVYQSVTSELRDAVKTNLHYFYGGFVLGNCTEVFPLGK